MSFLGLDVGEKRIGVAVSDELNLLAEGVGFILRKSDNQTFEAIKKYADEFQTHTIVVGLPQTLKGEQGTQAQKVLSFVERLRTEVSCPVIVWDERLTTAQAERALIERDISRAKRKQKRDAFASEIMLQCYLDYVRRKEK